jgi:hypothetical protein
MPDDRRTKLHCMEAAAIVTAAVWFLLSVLWDFYFDMNDDVLMKDILSGVYTGVPEALNIQMLAPVSFFVSLLYHLPGRADWYGIFLLLLQAVSFFLVLETALYLSGKRRREQDTEGNGSVRIAIEGTHDRIFRIGRMVLAGAAVSCTALLLMLYHAVIVQYTITVGCMSAAAAFLFLGMEVPDCSEPRFCRRFLKACLPSAVLIWLAFLLRSEMLLLMLPLILTAALFRTMEKRRADLDAFIPVRSAQDPEGKVSVRQEKKRHFRKTAPAVLLVLAVLSAGLLAGYGADAAAYGSPEWKEFRSWFDARTELYDFDSIPSYEENKSFYDSIGVNAASVELLQDYNFGLDDSLNADTLWKIADYADGIRTAGGTAAERLRDAAWNYRKHMFSTDDCPYNVLAAAGYVLLLLMAVTGAVDEYGGKSGKKLMVAILRTASELLFLFCVRSALWMYILYRGRAPLRITHSLYLAETAVLLGLILRFAAGLPKREQLTVPSELLILLGAVFFMPAQIRAVTVESYRRADVNAPYEEYLAYCSGHPDFYYLTDVYSTVDFSEKMFGAAAGSTRDGAANHDLMGGWACKSPLMVKKLEKFGYNNMKDALTGNDGCFAVVETGGDTSFLTDYYASSGEKIRADEYDRIGNSFTVFRVTKEDGK